MLSHESGGNGFAITYRLASDQTTLLPQVSIRTAEGTQNFDHLTFDLGLARIKQLVQAQASTNDQDRDGNSDSESSNSYVVDPDNQTPSSHEGDAN